MTTPYRIYMDVCCFNRPFDNWSQPRIRLEAEAVLAIAARCQTGDWQLIRSTALEAEIDRTPDPNRKQRVQDSLAIAQIQLFVTESMLKRANELSFLNFKSFDALHVACAEAANADILLTTDDRLIRKASQHQTTLSVRVANPITWLMEIMTQTGENHDDPR